MEGVGKLMLRRGTGRRCAVTLTFLSLLGCSHGTALHTKAQTEAARTVALGGGSFRIPEGFGKPAHLAADPKKAGVWTFAVSPGEARAFFWDAGDHQLRSWLLGDPLADRLMTGIENAIAVADDGTVWIGVNDTLIKLDPGSGLVTRSILPAPTAAPADPGRPGANAIRAVEPGPEGKVAVARSGAASVQVVDRNGKLIESVRLPAATEPVALAYATDGTLAIGLLDRASGQENKLHLHAAGGDRTVNVPAHTVVRADNAILSGRPEDGVIYSVKTDGTNAVVKLPAVASRVVVGGELLATASGVVVETVTGLAVEDLSAGTVTEYQLPTFDCSGGAIPGGREPPTSGLGKATCGQRAVAIAIDPTKAIWYIPSGPSPEIGAVTPEKA
jgi:hypothetical protein